MRGEELAHKTGGRFVVLVGGEVALRTCDYHKARQTCREIEGAELWRTSKEWPPLKVLGGES